MKPSVFAPFLALLFLPLYSARSAEVDPHVLDALRAETSTAQNFCFSFARDNVRNGITVAQNCLSFASARYTGNYDIADKVPNAGLGGPVISRAQDEFCVSIGEYSAPGGWVKSDCDAWNRARGELFTLGTTAGTSSSTFSVKIIQVEATRRRFCQSLLSAGNPGDPSVFAARMGACFALVNLGTTTDRAIFLGAF